MPPRFVNKMRNAIFVAGEDTQFTCVIQSAPSPKIRYACIDEMNHLKFIQGVLSSVVLCVHLILSSLAVYVPGGLKMESC